MSRTKDQWLRETGGFRFGETDAEFQHRTAEISRLRKKIEDSEANAADVAMLARLLDTDEAD